MRKALMLRGWLVVMLLGFAGFSTSVWAQSWPRLALKPIVSGLNLPLFVTHAGDQTGRLFVLEKAGVIKIFKDGVLLSEPFLDISSQVGSSTDDGLLCLAFPPGNGLKTHFYVYYATLDGSPVLSRFQVSANPDLADPGSEEQLLTFTPSDPAIHKGGWIGFHPLNHYLYVSTGDTGPQGDPNNNAQNPGVLRGKILRLDVEHGRTRHKPYKIPLTNPFVEQSNYLPEIWALGLRNPFRCSFAPNGDFYIGDVGYDTYEEIDFEGSSSTGGNNYGWNILEGPMITGFNGSVPPPNYVGPIASFIHPTMESLIGGYVYRGSQNPRMQGIYFFADFGEYASGTGQILGMKTDTRETKTLLSTDFEPCSLGEDEAGNLYVVGIFNGGIFQIINAPDLPDLTGIYELLLF